MIFELIKLSVSFRLTGYSSSICFKCNVIKKVVVYGGQNYNEASPNRREHKTRKEKGKERQVNTIKDSIIPR